MKFTEDSYGAHQLAVQTWDSMDRRRDGIHLTDIIYCLTKAAWKMKGEKRRPSDAAVGRMAAGVGLEAVLLAGQRKHLEMEVDDIRMTADLIEEDEYVTEVKSTRISPSNLPYHAKTGELYFPKGWLQQLKGYKKGLGVTAMRLAVFFVIPAEWKRWLVTSTQEEIDENWEYLKGRRDVLVNHLDKGWIPQPYRWRLWDTECDGCEMASLCAEWAANEELGRQLEQSIEQVAKVNAVEEATRVLRS